MPTILKHDDRPSAAVLFDAVLDAADSLLDELNEECSRIAALWAQGAATDKEVLRKGATMMGDILTKSEALDGLLPEGLRHDIRAMRARCDAALVALESRLLTD